MPLCNFYLKSSSGFLASDSGKIALFKIRFLNPREKQSLGEFTYFGGWFFAKPCSVLGYHQRATHLAYTLDFFLVLPFPKSSVRLVLSKIGTVESAGSCVPALSPF